MAYHTSEGFEICGLVSRSKSKEILNAQLGNQYGLFTDMEVAMRVTKPEAVCISTYPDTHEDFAVKAFEICLQVFIK